MDTKTMHELLKMMDVLYVTRTKNHIQEVENLLKLFFRNVYSIDETEKAFDIFYQRSPSLIITDIDLPRISGIHFIKEIRETNKNVPIIILSALKDEKYLFEAIKLRLSDYLVTPLKNIGILISAINECVKDILHEGYKKVYFSDEIHYDFVTKTLQKNDKTLKLTKNEYRLLEYLIHNSLKVVSKKEIEDYLWVDGDVTQSAFKSLLGRLTKKLGKEYITNTFGIGYQIKIQQSR
jgi:DNA-binding response OmpR family regulator